MHKFDARTDTVNKLNPALKKRNLTQVIKKSIFDLTLDFSSSVRTIIRDYRKRLITCDHEGIVRIHDPTKTIRLKVECAGNSKKVLKLNSTFDKLYYISGHDRSCINEVDLRSIDLKSREKRFAYPKIIDFVLVGDEHLITLNKDGWVELKDLSKREIPSFLKKKNKNAQSRPQTQSEEDEAEGKFKLPQDDVSEYTSLSFIESSEKLVAFGFKFIPSEDQEGTQNSQRKEPSFVHNSYKICNTSGHLVDEGSLRIPGDNKCRKSL